MAIAEAYILAGELCRANGDYAQAFTAYTAAAVVRVGEQNAAPRFRGFLYPCPLGVAVRNVELKALSIRFFAKRFLARSLRDDLELPEYASA